MGLYEWATVSLSPGSHEMRVGDKLWTCKLQSQTYRFEQGGVECGTLRGGVLKMTGEGFLVLCFALAMNEYQHEMEKVDQPSLQELAMSVMAYSADKKVEASKEETVLAAPPTKDSKHRRAKRRASTGSRAA